jgi:hypothetical protein
MRVVGLTVLFAAALLYDDSTPRLHPHHLGSHGSDPLVYPKTRF